MRPCWPATQTPWSVNQQEMPPSQRFVWNVEKRGGGVLILVAGGSGKKTGDARKREGRGGGGVLDLFTT